MPDLPAPITITLYEPNDEVKATYTRSVIPWGIFKKAVRLSKVLEGAEADSEQGIDAIAGLVVEAFGDQFSIADLDKGASVDDMMIVVKTIVARAGMLVSANPTPPPTAGKRSK